MTETKRRSPRAAVSRTESVLRLLAARQSNDLQFTERQRTLRRAAASADIRANLRTNAGASGEPGSVRVCVISIGANFIARISICAPSIFASSICASSI